MSEPEKKASGELPVPQPEQGKLGLIDWLKSKLRFTPKIKAQPMNTTGSQTPTFKERDFEQNGPPSWNLPPCECKATPQQVSGMLRCSNCGVQWWPHGKPEVYRGPQRNGANIAELMRGRRKV